MTNFIGREQELVKLEELMQKNTASMIVMRGRRRIGKTSLIKHFAKNFTYYAFEGLAPTNRTTAQMERDEFSRQLADQTGLPEIKADDWSKLFGLLADKVKTGRVIISFDEISWMGSKDPQFLSKIKFAWDNAFSKNKKLMLIICGSASSWIEKNILSSTGFLGRVSYTMTLHELPVTVLSKFWNNKNISHHEIFKVIAITGGVPKYLEEIIPTQTAEDNIKRLCFSAGGFLVSEFEHIFADLFLRESDIYQKIVTSLTSGSKEIKDIAEAIKFSRSGRLSEYLDELELAGFIEREYTWSLISTRTSTSSKYRLKDNYLRFYLKYILPDLGLIKRDAYGFKNITSLPHWTSVAGLQFENLVINNKEFIHAALSLKNEDIIFANSYFQHANTKSRGCQIDYLIQDRFNSLYVCEIKFSINPIGCEIIKEVQSKVESLRRPKYFSCRPILIHVSDITQDLEDSRYFAKIIDFNKFMRGA
jgi:AAA+ ATPase superfamily predicted ATPase